MIEMLTTLNWWQWIVMAVALAALEALMPGAVAIWFAVSALVVGLLLVVLPLPWQWQWVLFAVLGLVAMVVYRNYKSKHPEVSEQPNLNQRGRQHIGQVFTLIEPIHQGLGKVRVGDGVWTVASESEVPAGAPVRVTGVDGALLKVEPA
jgi:membrane protein implicated in regulation of membrane protease activity